MTSLIERGSNRRGCSCRPIFNRRWGANRRGVHAGQFSIKGGC